MSRPIALPWGSRKPKNRDVSINPDVSQAPRIRRMTGSLELPRQKERQNEMPVNVQTSGMVLRARRVTGRLEVRVMGAADKINYTR